MTEHGYIFSVSGRTFAPEGEVTTPVDVDAHNRAVEARELAIWHAQPDTFVGYYTIRADERTINRFEYLRSGRPVTVSTWLGTRLGHGLVTGAHTNNFGARIVRVRILGTNGAEYWGAASYDAELITLHRVRPSRRATRGA